MRYSTKLLFPRAPPDKKAGGTRPLGPGDFAEAADDYDIAVGASSPKDAANKLKALKEKGVTIDEVHIFGHGAPGFAHIGVTGIWPDSDNWKTIASTVEPGGTIILHGCRIAGADKARDGDQYLQDLADAGQRAVEGWTGVVKIFKIPIPFFKDYYHKGEHKRKEPRSDRSPHDDNRERSEAAGEGDCQ